MKNYYKPLIFITLLVLGVSAFYLTAGNKQDVLGDSISTTSQVEIKEEPKKEVTMETPYVNSTGEILVKNFDFLGNKQSPVTILEFSDFDCHYCVSFKNKIYPKLLESYISTKKIKYSAINYPRAGLNSKSAKASKLIKCTTTQNTADKELYFKLVQDIFKRGLKYNIENIKKEYISSYSLNSENLETCIKSDESKKHVEALIQLNRDVFLTKTPSIFIGTTNKDGFFSGERLFYFPQYETYRKIIDKLLREQVNL